MSLAIGYALGAMLCFGLGDLVYKCGAAAGAPAHQFLMVQSWFVTKRKPAIGYDRNALGSSLKCADNLAICSLDNSRSPLRNMDTPDSLPMMRPMSACVKLLACISARSASRGVMV